MKVSFIFMALLVANFAHAGEILRFKSGGSIKPMTNSLADVVADPGLYVVQWKNLVHESEKEQLERLGAKIINYIPDDAFLIKADRDLALRLEGLSFVRVVMPYEPGLKVEPELTAHGIFSFNEQQTVTVLLDKESDASNFRYLMDSVLAEENEYVIAKVTTGNLWEIAKQPEVLWIERYIPIQNMSITAAELGADASSLIAETQTGYESGTKVMNADRAYELGFNGQGQIVAFADTGLDKGDINTLIPDFRGQVLVGHAVGLGGSSWGDPHNHGTHVAGSIAGSGVSSNGLIRGTAYGAKLVAMGMWSDLLNNIVPPRLDRMFKTAYDDGARIHSNSWGAPNSKGRYDSMTALADEFMFRNQDFLAVFAAGNDGKDLSRDGVIDEGSVSSPGSAKNVLTVGASKNYLLEGGIQRKLSELRNGTENWGVEPLASSFLSEDMNGMACFSSRGPTADGRIKPEIVAPGTNIVSARNTHPKADPNASWGVYNDHYLYMGGTSMATPLTSGAMAVVRQVLLAKTGASSVSAALMKATVAITAKDLYPGQFGERAKGQEQPTRRPNNHEGWGRVDLAKLVDHGSISFHDERAGLATGQVKEYTFQSDGSRPFMVTMAYTDAPGAASANKALVNDLDLSVIGPNGQTYYPNGKTAKDNTNNMEQIDILSASAGTYKVIVRAANVPNGLNGAQPFALVVAN
ncbi:MAG: S8 family serine peptidase [Oligoflexia bacterium]|nr:S8 family serine peptidase [Oligoflexia bacterium]